ncbi:MAG: HAD-IIIC family phosphatase [Lachnospiraceae bacterium]|nr:HAD-IIIC family phosphatase [Lachnospiraceae bacterium]
MENNQNSYFIASEDDYRRLSDKKILIVIVSYNSAHLMEENIKSIRATLPEDLYKIVVVDNASTDGVTDYLERQGDIILIKNDTNKGFSPACNQGVKAAAGTGYETADVFFLNNDTRLCDNSLYYLMKALYEDESTGAVGSISNYAGNRQQMSIDLDRAEKYLDLARLINIPKEDCTDERVRLSGFAMLIRRKLFDDIGGFDEDFAPGYFEDDALSMEILKRGYRLKVVNNSFIYHAGSQSFAKTDDYETLLNDHRQLFIKKYGFDIISYAYGSEVLPMKLPYKPGDSFGVLQLGAGLGADLKAIRNRFKNAYTAGIEFDENLCRIAGHTENIFPSIEAVRQADSGFNALIIDPDIIKNMSKEEKEALVALCRPDAVLITKDHALEDFPFDKVKLIVWDMDDTFWQGTLSEENVTIPAGNIELVKELTNNGIINSISSKNDEAPVMEKLKEAGVDDLFVFNNINWEEKGPQLAKKIERMGLRDENVLLIDDNPRNLEEARFASKNLLTATPDILPYLINHVLKLGGSDREHKRLSQYKLLEKKTEAMDTFSSKEAFLYESKISVAVCKNCLEELDRIAEMVSRTNQLNYTKNRDDKELLTRLITNDWNDCGYVRVRDKFGDYGIVGFYCYNTREKKMEHFLFSCRILGMGVEQYIYNLLGCPDFEVKDPVASVLSKDADTPWITEDTGAEVTADRVRDNRIRILLKGPCDMSAIEPYLTGGNITTEFNYVNEYGFVTTGQNHTAHIRQSLELSPEEIDEIINDVPFIVHGDFETKLFSEEYHIICLSLLQDLSAGLYRNRKTGTYISFSSKNFDLTSSEFKQRFIDKTVQGHDFDFTQEIIDRFAENWEFVGSTPLDMLLSNLDFIYDHVKGNPLFILMLGSERDYEGYNEEFAGLCDVYREINPIIESFAADHDRIRVINPTPYIHSQEDFADCINHFSRNVYYGIAGEICDRINEVVERLAKERNTASKNIDKKAYDEFVRGLSGKNGTDEYDVLIVITPDDYDRVKRNYKNIAKYMPGRKVIFIGNDAVGERVKTDAISERFDFINENDILPFAEVEAVLKDILKVDDIPRGMTGWYYQQFLKMSYSFICRDEYYMTWDGDTIPCKSFDMFAEDGTPFFDLKQEYCENYFITLERLFPYMKKCIEKSFISEHMLMKKDFMQEMIKAIEGDERLAGKTYYEKILRTIDRDKLKASSFSEFETYGTFVSMKHFGAYKLRNWHSFRYCGNFFDPDTITDEDYEWLSHDFEAVSFEKRANRTEEGMALFKNPRYREKLSARQIVEAIQEESEGYKEVWD